MKAIIIKGGIYPPRFIQALAMVSYLNLMSDHEWVEIQTKHTSLKDQIIYLEGLLMANAESYRASRSPSQPNPG